MYMIMYSVCHYIFYYMTGNWIIFSCLYSNQEIRLTDVPLILMATSSHYFFLTVLPLLHLCSRSLSLPAYHSLSLSLSPHSLSSPTFSSTWCVLCSAKKAISIQNRSHDQVTWIWLLVKAPARQNKNVLVCWFKCITQMWAVFASWKCCEIALCCCCCCWQTKWVHAAEIQIQTLFYDISRKADWICCNLQVKYWNTKRN